jgi:GT2 family glycosyltransferase
MKELLIVACTKESNLDKVPLGSTVWKQKHMHNSVFTDVEVIANNTKGLSECYNKILRDDDIVNNYSVVLFVHDDVELEDINLKDKLLNSPYDVTGLAGAKMFNKDVPKLAWHLAAPREMQVGEVAHCHEGKVWTTVFGPTKSRALTLDGLFLAVKPKVLREKGLEFDENFNFHFYDLAFCMRANQKRVTCGVLPIRVVHHGLGDSMLTEDWEQSNIKFRKAYCS